jgi:hypothetical protein
MAKLIYFHHGISTQKKKKKKKDKKRNDKNTLRSERPMHTWAVEDERKSESKKKVKIRTQRTLG